MKKSVLAFVIFVLFMYYIMYYFVLTNFVTWNTFVMHVITRKEKTSLVIGKAGQPWKILYHGMDHKLRVGE